MGLQGEVFFLVIYNLQFIQNHQVFPLFMFFLKLETSPETACWFCMISLQCSFPADHSSALPSGRGTASFGASFGVAIEPPDMQQRTHSYWEGDHPKVSFSRQAPVVSKIFHFHFKLAKMIQFDKWHLFQMAGKKPTKLKNAQVVL